MRFLEIEELTISLNNVYSLDDERNYFLKTKVIDQNTVEITVVLTDEDDNPTEVALSRPVKCRPILAANVIDQTFEYGASCYSQFFDQPGLPGKFDYDDVTDEEVAAFIQQLIDAALDGHSALTPN